MAGGILLAARRLFKLEHLLRRLDDADAVPRLSVDSAEQSPRALQQDGLVHFCPVSHTVSKAFDI